MDTNNPSRASGRAYTGFLADGSGGARAPGVLVIHEGGGLTGHAKGRAAMLAEQFGMVAFAMDLFGAPAAARARRRGGGAGRWSRSCAADVAELRAR